jgi:hypothetical protein
MLCPLRCPACCHQNGSTPGNDVLLAAWGATMGRPAFLTSAVFDILGSAPRSFRQRVTDHGSAFEVGVSG